MNKTQYIVSPAQSKLLPPVCQYTNKFNLSDSHEEGNISLKSMKENCIVMKTDNL